MAAEQAIYAALKALVASSDGAYRCYPVKMPQKTVLPVIVYARESTETTQTLDRSTTIENGVFSLNIYADTLDEASDLADDVKTNMATAGVTNELQGESVEYDPDTDLDYVSLRYSCWEVS